MYGHHPLCLRCLATTRPTHYIVKAKKPLGKYNSRCFLGEGGLVKGGLGHLPLCLSSVANKSPTCYITKVKKALGQKAVSVISWFPPSFLFRMRPLKRNFPSTLPLARPGKVSSVLPVASSVWYRDTEGIWWETYGTERWTEWVNKGKPLQVFIYSL